MRDSASKDTKKAAGVSGRPLRRELFALFGFQFREPFEDERVSLIGTCLRKNSLGICDERA
jgi:hypothetical protein